MGSPAFRGAAEFDTFMGRLLRRYAFVNHLNMGYFAEAFAGHLRALGVPRDPFLLLPMMGVKLERSSHLLASRAVWVRSGGAYTIHYSQYERSASIRFSLWHETFEILAGHPRFPSLLSDVWKERLADRFAASLLMPEWAVRREVKRFATNGEGLVAVLAERFGVSHSALRRRLREVAPRCQISCRAGRPRGIVM